MVVEGKTSKSFTTFRHSLRLFNSFCSFLLIPLILLPSLPFFFFYCIAITRLNYGQAWHAWTNGGHRAAYKLLNNAPVPRRRDSTTLKSRLSAATRVFRRFASKKRKEKKQKSRSPLPSCSLPLSRFPMETNSSFHRSRPRRRISRTSGFPFRKILRDTLVRISIRVLLPPTLFFQKDSFFLLEESNWKDFSHKLLTREELIEFGGASSR